MQNPSYFLRMIFKCKMPPKYTEISPSNFGICNRIINFKIHYEILTGFLSILVEFGILLTKQGEMRTWHLG